MEDRYAFIFTYLNNVPDKRWIVDLQELDKDIPTDTNNAHLVFKFSRKKSKIHGILFTMFWRGHLFSISKKGKEFITIELPIFILPGDFDAAQTDGTS